MGLISRVSSRTYRVVSQKIANMLFTSGRVLNWALARRTYMSKARELHLKRQGMDRDNFLHDQKQGRGIMIVSGIVLAFYGVYGGYWRHCQFEENKFVRLPINEREREPIWAVICQRQKIILMVCFLEIRFPFLVIHCKKLGKLLMNIKE